MTRTTKTIPIKIKVNGIKGDFSFKHWKGFNFFSKWLKKDYNSAISYLEWLSEITLLEKAVYFEAKKGTSDKLPTILKKALKNPIKL